MEQQQPSHPLPTQTKKSSLRGTKVIIGILVIIILIIFGSMLGKSSSKSTNTSNSSSQPAQSQASGNTQTSTQPAQQAPQDTHPHFGDGTLKVGTDIQPGTYRTRTASQGCYWERLKDFTGGVDSILANDNTDYPAVVTILPTDAGFKSTNCGTLTKPISYHHLANRIR